jgi:single-strand DNA-binding protein
MAAKLHKGDKVNVIGHLRYNSWEKDGVKRSKLEVIADSVEHTSPLNGEA